MGSSPIPAATPDSLVGRARTKTKNVSSIEKGLTVDSSRPVTLRPVIRATPTIVRMCTLLGKKELDIAGWRSQLSRQGHYLKISGAEPLPATISRRGEVSLTHQSHYLENARAELAGATIGSAFAQKKVP